MKRGLLLITLLILITDLNAQFRKRGNNPVSSSGSSQSGLNYSRPSEYTIADIKVSVLKVLDYNALISLTGLKVGDKVDIPGDAISIAI